MKKIIAITLSVCLVFSEVSLAGDVSLVPGQAFKLPPEIGKVQEVYSGRSEKKIFFIQDAHDSPDAQANIAEILKHLIEKDGVRTVYEEGYEGVVPTQEYFGFLDKPEHRKKLGDFLVDHLRMGGAEYLHLQNPESFRLIGADDRQLHQENIAWYGRSAEFRPLIEKQLRGLVDQVRSILIKNFSPAMKKWFRARQSFLIQTLGVDGYLESLRQASQKERGVSADFKDYPQMQMILQLKAQKKVESSELESFSAQALFEEIESFEQMLIGTDSATPVQKAFELFRVLERLERMSHLQVSSQEFEWLMRQKLTGWTLQAAEFIAQVNRKPVALPVLWEKEIDAAVQFYKTAYLRDEALRKTLRADFKESRAALVYGGFHSDRIKQILKDEGHGYVVIMPVIKEISVTHQKRYQKLMRGEKYDFEMRKAAGFARPESVFVKPRSEARPLLRAAGISAPEITQRSEARRVDETDIQSFLKDKDQYALYDFTETDRVDDFLLNDAKKNKRPYVRLALRSRADMNRLLSRLTLDNQGEPGSEEGVLYEVLRKGGILLIDYANSYPGLVEEFNSLFDRAAYFKKLKQIHPDLKIIGAIPPSQRKRYSGAMRSRYQHKKILKFEKENFSDETLLKHIHSDALPQDAVEIDLYQGDPFDSALPVPLIDGVKRGQDGKLIVVRGALAQAIQTGKPLVIRRGNFKAESALRVYLRRAAYLGVEVYSEEESGWRTIEMPEGLKIYFSDAPSDDELKHVKERKIQGDGELSVDPENVWVVTAANAHTLFEMTQVNPEGKLASLPGIPERGSAHGFHLTDVNGQRKDDRWNFKDGPLNAAQGEQYIPADHTGFESAEQKVKRIEDVLQELKARKALPEDFVVEKKVSIDAETGEIKLNLSDVQLSAHQWQAMLKNIQGLGVEDLDLSGSNMDEKMFLKPAKAHIRIAGDLPKEIWHRLMGSAGNFTLEVAPHVRIPAAYLGNRTPAAAQTKKPAPVKKTWDEVSSQAPVTFVKSDDFGMETERIQSRNPVQAIEFLDMNSDADASRDLTGEIGKTGKHSYRFDERPLFSLLNSGKTVVLRGLDAAPDLAEDLATLQAPEPYLLVNGKKHFLKDMPGRLYVLFAQDSETHPTAAYVEQPVTEDEITEILAREFPDAFSSQNYKQLLTVIQTLRHEFPEIPFSLPLNRLRHIYSNYADTKDWGETLKLAIANEYWGNFERESYVGSLIRHTFKVEEKSKIYTKDEIKEITQKSNSVAQSKLDLVLEKMVEPMTWKNFGWQAADSLSTDLLLQLWPNNPPGFKEFELAFPLIRRALARHHPNLKYRTIFEERLMSNERAELETAPDIDSEFKPVSASSKSQTAHQLDQAKKELHLHRAVMLLGLPGVGKSHSVDELAMRLGLDPKNPKHVYRRTTGGDTKREDIVGRSRVENDVTVFNVQDDDLAAWAENSDGGLFLYDEANLTDPHFWNFLRGFFAKEPFVWVNGKKIKLTQNHRILFTGNPYSMQGRKMQELLQEFVFTVPFESFDEAFMRERIDVLLSKEMDSRSDVIDWIYGMYDAMNRIRGVSEELSLRDIRETVARVNRMYKKSPEKFKIPDDLKNEVFHLAWRQYRGLLTREQREAVSAFLLTRWGVYVSGLGGLSDREEAPTHEAYQKFVMTESTRHFASVVEDSFDMIADAIESGESSEGKTGLFSEGPSGRIKSEIILAGLEAHDYKEAGTEPAGWPKSKIFYRIVASPDSADELIKIIKKARRDGSVVVIDEINLLPSSFLEGRLNDVLTGKAAPGFFLFASMNSTDFSGRQKLSSALQNRVVYVRLEPYSQEELAEIALHDLTSSVIASTAKQSSSGTASPEAPRAENKRREVLANRLAAFHVWLRDQIEDKSMHPTPRELRLAAKLLAGGMAWSEAIDEVYGVDFLENGGNPITIPNDEILDQYKEISDWSDENERKYRGVVRFLQIYVSMFLPPGVKSPEVEIVKTPDFAGQYDSGTNKIKININQLLNSSGDSISDWRDTLHHELSHLLHTGEMRPPGAVTGWPGAFLAAFIGGGALDQLWQDLEDIRHERTFNNRYPGAGLAQPSKQEVEFAELITSGKIDGLISMLQTSPTTLRQVFQLILTVSARGLVTDDEVTAFEKAFTNKFNSDVDLQMLFMQVNPVKVAFEYLEKAKRYVSFVPDANAGRLEIEWNYEMAQAELEGLDAVMAAIPEKNPFGNEYPSDVESTPAQTNAEFKPKIGSGTAVLDYKALAEQKRIKLRREIEDVLTVMENDLNGNVSLALLQENLDRLTDEDQEGEIVSLLKQINDDALNQRSNDLIKHTEAEIKEILDFESRWRDQTDHKGGYASGEGGGGYASGKDPFTGSGLGSRQKQTRFSGKKSHSKHGAHKSQAKATPPKVIGEVPKVSQSIKISAVAEVQARDPLMADITKESEAIFREVLHDLFDSENMPRDQQGARGRLDTHLLAQTGDPQKSHIYSAPDASDLKPKTLVLTGGLPQGKMNPLVQEFFEYLFSKKFQVIVYLDAGNRTEIIRDRATLEAALSQAKAVDETAIRNDLKEKNETHFKPVGIAELQQRFEHIYYAGALRKAARGEKLTQQADPVADPAKEAVPGAETADELEKRANQILAKIQETVKNGKKNFAATMTTNVEDGRIVLIVFPENLDSFDLLGDIEGVDVLRIRGKLPEDILIQIDQKVIGRLRKSIKALELAPTNQYASVSEIKKDAFNGFENLEAILMGNVAVDYYAWDHLAPLVKSKIRKLAFTVGGGVSGKAFSEFSSLEDLEVNGSNFGNVLESRLLSGLADKVKPNIKRLRISNMEGIAQIARSFTDSGLTGLEDLTLDFPNALRLEDLEAIPEALRLQIKKLAILNNKKITDWIAVFELFPNLEVLDIDRALIIPDTFIPYIDANGWVPDKNEKGTMSGVFRKKKSIQFKFLRETPEQKVETIKTKLKFLESRDILTAENVSAYLGKIKVNTQGLVEADFTGLQLLSPDNWKQVLAAFDGAEVLLLNNTNIQDLSLIPKSVKSLQLKNVKSKNWQPLSQLKLELLNVNGSNMNESELVEPVYEGDQGGFRFSGGAQDNEYYLKNYKFTDGKNQAGANAPALDPSPEFFEDLLVEEKVEKIREVLQALKPGNVYIPGDIDKKVQKSTATNLVSVDLSDLHLQPKTWQLIITAIQGLGVEELKLSRSNITDISNLPAESLKSLWLDSATHIDTWGNWDRFKQLENLNLSFTEITDISKLPVSLKELKVMQASRLFQFDGLMRLINLKFLDWRENSHADFDISFVPESVVKLWLKGNRVKDSQALARLTNLEELDVNRTNINKDEIFEKVKLSEKGFTLKEADGSINFANKWKVKQTADKRPEAESAEARAQAIRDRLRPLTVSGLLPGFNLADEVNANDGTVVVKLHNLDLNESSWKQVLSKLAGANDIWLWAAKLPADGLQVLADATGETLEHLDLMGANLPDWKDLERFSHLKNFNASDSNITEEGVRALPRTLENLNLYSLKENSSLTVDIFEKANEGEGFALSFENDQKSGKWKVRQTEDPSSKDEAAQKKVEKIRAALSPFIKDGKLGGEDFDLKRKAFVDGDTGLIKLDLARAKLSSDGWQAVLNSIQGLGVEDLNLGYTDITDLSLLPDSLKRLNLAAVQNAKWEYISSLKNLEDLDLVLTDITDLSVLPKGLERLSLAGVLAPGLASLGHLKKLKQLDLTRVEGINEGQFLEPAPEGQNGFDLIGMNGTKKSEKWKFRDQQITENQSPTIEDKQATVEKIRDALRPMKDFLPSYYSVDKNVIFNRSTGLVTVDLSLLDFDHKVWKAIMAALENSGVEAVALNSSNITDFSLLPVSLRGLYLYDVKNANYNELSRLSNLEYLQMQKTGINEDELFRPVAAHEKGGFTLVGVDGYTKDGKWKVRQTEDKQQLDIESIEDLFKFLERMKGYLIGSEAEVFEKAFEILEKEGFGDFIPKFKAAYEGHYKQPFPARSEHREEPGATDFKEHKSLLAGLSQLAGLKAIIVIDAAVLAERSPEQIEEYQKLLTQSPETKMFVTGNRPDESKNWDDLKSWLSERIQIGEPSVPELEKAERVLYFGNEQSLPDLKVLPLEQRLIKIRYESEEDVGLPTLALLLPEDELEKLKKGESFLTWSHLKGLARLALSVLSAYVVARSA